MTTTRPWVRNVLEAVVIVGSILLAFGIQAWWDNEQERQRERAYLGALLDEFEQVRDGLPAGWRSRASAVHAHEALLEQIQGAPRAQEDSLFFWASGASLQLSLDPPRAVLDDIGSSGGTQLIRSDSLRLALGRYGAAVARAQYLEGQAWSTWELRIQPIIEGRISRIERIRQGRFAAGRNVPFGPSRHVTDWDSLFRDPAFEDVIAERWLRLQLVSGQFQTVSEQVDRLIELIRRELDGQG